MSAFRAFMIYDYQRNFFFMFIRRGFQVSPKWNGCRKELENKLQEMIKEPLEQYEQVSDYGKFKCKYDKKNKCYFILLCSDEVKEEKQLEVLNEIYDIILENPNYQKIKKDELESKQSSTISSLLQKNEQEYLEQFGQVKQFDEPYVPQKEVQKGSIASSIESQQKQNQQSSIQSSSKINNNVVQSQIGLSNNQIIQNTSILKSNHRGFNSEADLNPDTLIKIFRCFMMWDYNRQFFFMFIRKGFPIDKIWSAERCKIETELKSKVLDPNDPKAKPKEPPETFDYKGDFGLYKAKYDKKTKCYFILLSRFKTKEEPQVKLLDALYDEVQKQEKYCSIKYDELETKKKKALEKIIDEQEKLVTQQVSQQFIDSKLLESKIGKLYSPEQFAKNERSSVSPLNSQKNLSSKKSSIFVSKGQLQQQYQKQDDVIQDEEDIPDYTEQGQIGNKMSQYQSKKIDIKQYVSKEN